MTRGELLLLLGAWVAIFGLFVVIPWVVIALTTRVLEATEQRPTTRRARTGPETPALEGDPETRDIDRVGREDADALRRDHERPRFR
ncbi:hypothetical protein [Halomicrococcus sp. NG-SE-24]|uniref:hypothetical protein n=1 Tax=Halomicrococcus sp. NG-SE-24 TaxID=3436928 RepID=UPI003D95D2E5